MLSGREPLWGFAERKLRAPLLQSGAACRDPAGRISSVQEQPCEASRRTRAMQGPQQLRARLTSGPAAPAGLSTDGSPPGGASEKCPPRGHLFKSAFLCHSGFQLVCVSVLWLLCFRLLGKSMETTALLKPPVVPKDSFNPCQGILIQELLFNLLSCRYRWSKNFWPYIYIEAGIAQELNCNYSSGWVTSSALLRQERVSIQPALCSLQHNSTQPAWI